MLGDFEIATGAKWKTGKRENSLAPLTANQQTDAMSS